MEINRADMKLLTEAGYSSLVRGIDTDVSSIFQALDTWMPEFAAGPIGLALQEMMSGDYDKADARLDEILKSGRQGAEEATAMLAFCKALKEQFDEAARLAATLKDTGGHAEDFVQTLMATREDSSDSQARGFAENTVQNPAQHGSGQRE